MSLLSCTFRIASACVIAWLADAGTKWWALNHDQASIITIVPGLFYALVPPLTNPGGGYLLSGVGVPGALMGVIRYATLVVPIVLSIASLGWMYWVERNTPKLTLSEQLGFGMLLGGTFSNIADRLAHGSVVDFLHMPFCDLFLFNVADVTIALGLFLVGADALRLQRLTKFLGMLIKQAPATEA